MSARIDTVTTHRRVHRWTVAVGVLGLLLGVLALLTVLLPGPLYHYGYIGLRAAFGAIRIGAIAGIAAILVCLAGIGMALRPGTRRHLLFAAVGLLLGIAAFVPPWLLARRAGSLPAIHDISTDTANPPPFVAILPLRAEAPNSPVYGGAEVAAKQQAAYPDIQPLLSTLAPADVLDMARKVAVAMKWRIVAEQADTGRLEATSTTRWFGFKDDVVIRIRAEGAGSRLDIRSESRLGGSDIGANAARIREFEMRMRQMLREHSAP
ncbi:DUF1499 domain-containing protein [Rhodanobacter sp. AS-Z3]|uniref:DUF1499 domain-containing protein n=1 Tax=Rhodanobacter sp. AS-Z3 TaxID=3031330 RepID=UPI002479A557|nr:DUF1499 domain-containing protein [Rhodanobacter sp. AS-Z3]WEN13911.1 DUF1499 domain-containing protein [Rhodanobacter sp. AS-Z3]